MSPDSGLPAAGFQRSAPIFAAETVPFQRVPEAAARPRPAAQHQPVETAAAAADTARDLVLLVQAGDNEAFGQLFDQYHPIVFRFVYFKVSRNRQVAEDLTSDTFLRALKNIDRFRWPAGDRSDRLAAWMITIARNLVSDHYKRASNRYEVQTEAPDTEADLRSASRSSGRDASDPATIVVDEVMTRALYKALGELTEIQREVLILRFLHGLSTEECAKLLSSRWGRPMNQQAVKAAQYRGVRACARHLPDGIWP